MPSAVEILECKVLQQQCQNDITPSQVLIEERLLSLAENLGNGRKQNEGGLERLPVGLLAPRTSSTTTLQESSLSYAKNHPSPQLLHGNSNFLMKRDHVHHSYLDSPCGQHCFRSMNVPQTRHSFMKRLQALSRAVTSHTFQTTLPFILISLLFIYIHFIAICHFCNSVISPHVQFAIYYNPLRFFWRTEPKRLILILRSCSLLFLLICHDSLLTLQSHSVPPDLFSHFSRLFWTQKALQSLSHLVLYKFKEHNTYCIAQVIVWWEPSHSSTEPHSVYPSVLILLHTTKNYSQKLFFQPVLSLPSSIFI